MNLVTFYDYLEDARILAQQNERIAIHACLEEILVQGVKAEPKLIVELGVSKEALANKVLGYIARLFDSDFISCDLYDFSDVQDYPKWLFIQSNDIEFGEDFLGYCFRKNILPKIDLLFIDTDEKYPHTLEAAKIWYPFLSERCIVMWRCTNLKKELIYLGGVKTNLGWDNKRGVVRAIEEYHGWTILEDKEISGLLWLDRQGINWEVHHYPWGAGLTVMRKL